MTACVGGADLIELILEHTHACYKGDRNQTLLGLRVRTASALRIAGGRPSWLNPLFELAASDLVGDVQDRIVRRQVAWIHR
jgi:hypothetical protein